MQSIDDKQSRIHRNLVLFLGNSFLFIFLFVFLVSLFTDFFNSEDVVRSEEET